MSFAGSSSLWGAERGHNSVGRVEAWSVMEGDGRKGPVLSGKAGLSIQSQTERLQREGPELPRLRTGEVKICAAVGREEATL